jgi:hypothetical protein
MKAFLNQFAASRNDFEGWPSWMKNSAREVGATFPKAQQSNHEEAAPSAERIPDKDKQEP